MDLQTIINGVLFIGSALVPWFARELWSTNKYQVLRGASITAQPMGAIKPGNGRLELVQGFPASALTNANFTNTTALVLSATYEV